MKGLTRAHLGSLPLPSPPPAPEAKNLWFHFVGYQPPTPRWPAAQRALEALRARGLRFRGRLSGERAGESELRLAGALARERWNLGVAFNWVYLVVRGPPANPKE